MSNLPIYLFIFIVFLNRYVFGLYLTLVRGRKLDSTIEGYEPTITVVVPLFNEGRSIYDTIVSLVGLDYPQDKLEVTVVDDCSTDDSYEWAMKAAAEYPNVTVLRNPFNMGKRKGINAAVRIIRHVLTDHAAAPQFVQTMPRRGYRFVAVVEHVSESPQPRQSLVERFVTWLRR